MNNTKIFINDFEEVKALKIKLKEAKKEVQKSRRRLITLENKYKFLSEIVDINSKNKELIKSVKAYFKEIKLKHQEVDKQGKEDFGVWHKNKLILVEVTGTKNAVLSQDKTHQISKHINIRQSAFPNLNVSGLFICNHDSETQYNLREQNPFPKDTIEIASHNKYSLITTVSLVSAFLKLKRGEITLDTLVDTISTYGEIRF